MSSTNSSKFTVDTVRDSISFTTYSYNHENVVGFEHNIPIKYELTPQDRAELRSVVFFNTFKY